MFFKYFCTGLFLAGALALSPAYGDVSATGSINPSTRYQVLEGFGASGAWSDDTLITLHNSHPEIYNILFGELGLDIYRIRNTYDYDSGYIDRAAAIISGARSQTGRPLKVMISSWSPPGSLKSCGATTCYNGTLAGGPSSYVYTSFANWWYNSLLNYSSHGINADYINMQNEPDYTTSGWDTCRFNPTQNSSFAGYREAFRALYAKLNADLPNHPKILVPEAAGMTNFSGYVDILTSTDKSNIYGWSHHLYNWGDGGTVDNPDGYITKMTSFAATYNDKPRLQTEFSRGDSNALTFTDAMNLAKLLHNSLVYEQVSAYLYWELYWGPPKGLVSITSSTYTRNPVYYAFKHYSAYTDPNWQRVYATTSTSDLRISAYISPDSNNMSAVIINTSSSNNYALSLTFNNITVVSGNVYRTSETENCVLVGPYDKSQPLVLDANSITTIALTTSIDTTPPAAPTGLSATAGDGIVWLDWNGNTEPDLAGYNIYRSTTPGVYGEPLNASLLDSPNYTDSDVNNGITYYYVVTAVDTSMNESYDSSSEVSASPSVAVGAMGTILREWWMGIAGGLVSDLTSDPNFPDSPTGIEQLNTLEGPTNWADSYGARISGYLYPPQTGSYTFWIASDANSQLWLSTDGDPENAALIANVPGFTSPRQWNKYSQQQSSPISLTAGRKYYIEVLHKEDTGNDNVAVAWQGPGITPRQIIYGTYLSPCFIGFYGDLTHDGEVDNNDLADFTELWLEDDCQQTSTLDLDGDCVINFCEFSAMAENWLKIIVPSAPTNLSITAAGAASVSLDWDDNSGSFLAGYNVYRSTASGSGYSRVNSSIVTTSNYTDNFAVLPDGNTYYYVVTAADIYSNESGYSNEVSRLVIQENTTGFCSVDGSILATYSGYTGTGYADTSNISGVGINWKINIPSDGTYTFAWRFANGSSSDRPARLLVGGSEAVSSISFPPTGSYSTWSLVAVNYYLTAGTYSIRLEATGSSGLANIDYLMATGGLASPSPASCP